MGGDTDPDEVFGRVIGEGGIVARGIVMPDLASEPIAISKR